MSARRKARRIFKCLCMILDMERRAGLYVITSGTRLGWFVIACFIACDGELVGFPF